MYLTFFVQLLVAVIITVNYCESSKEKEKWNALNNLEEITSYEEQQDGPTVHESDSNMSPFGLEILHPKTNVKSRSLRNGPMGHPRIPLPLPDSPVPDIAFLYPSTEDSLSHPSIATSPSTPHSQNLASTSSESTNKDSYVSSSTRDPLISTENPSFNTQTPLILIPNFGSFERDGLPADTVEQIQNAIKSINSTGQVSPDSISVLQVEPTEKPTKCSSKSKKPTVSQFLNSRMDSVIENLSTLKILLASQEHRINENTKQVMSTRIDMTKIASEISKGVPVCAKENMKMESVEKMVANVYENMTRSLIDVKKQVSIIENRYDTISNIEKLMKKTEEAVENCKCSSEKSDSITETENQKAINSLKTEVQNLFLKMNILAKRMEDQGENNSIISYPEGNRTFVHPTETNGSIEQRLIELESGMLELKDLREEVTTLRKMVLRDSENESTTTTTTQLCVYPYKASKDGCYFVNTDERLNWIAARGRCRELQGDLAAPRNFENFRQFLVTQRLSRSYSFWVSGNDQTTEGQWVWADGRPVPKAVWASGQPNRLKSANCLEIKPGFKFVGADEDCRQQKYFVCQQRGS